MAVRVLQCPWSVILYFRRHARKTLLICIRQVLVLLSQSIPRRYEYQTIFPFVYMEGKYVSYHNTYFSMKLHVMRIKKIDEYLWSCFRESSSQIKTKAPVIYFPFFPTVSTIEPNNTLLYIFYTTD